MFDMAASLAHDGMFPCLKGIDFKLHTVDVDGVRCRIQMWQVLIDGSYPV